MALKMERGTEDEKQAVRERWAAIERTQTLVTRLLGAMTLVGAGIVLLLLAAAQNVCYTTIRGGIIGCTPTTQGAVGVIVGIFGLIALSSGIWIGWTISRSG